MESYERLTDCSKTKELLMRSTECGVCNDIMWTPATYVKCLELSDGSKNFFCCRITECGHSFCSPCMLQWFKMQRDSRKLLSCPTCRGNVEERPVQAFALKEIIRTMSKCIEPGRISVSMHEEHSRDFVKEFDKIFGK